MFGRVLEYSPRPRPPPLHPLVRGLVLEARLRLQLGARAAAASGHTSRDEPHVLCVACRGGRVLAAREPGALELEFLRPSASFWSNCLEDIGAF